MKAQYRIIYFLDNKLGGVTSLNYNLMKHSPGGFQQEVILLDNASDPAARPSVRFPADKETLFHFDSRDNLSHVLRRLHHLIPAQPGALVVNYGMEMAMLDHFQVPQTVYQLVHDDYNLKLALEYGNIVDVFISHNRDIFRKLSAALPSRAEDIFYLPNGVAVPPTCRKPAGDRPALKLLFLGRITRGKGVFDLPEIAALLREKGVEAEWTCIGAGPDEEAFRKAWSREDKVRFLSPASGEEVLAVCADHDIFILPTKFEGSPVSLLETMSVGLVPVISDLPGGIRETVSQDIGFRVAVNDNEAFAGAIEKLFNNRPMLEEMSVNCRKRIEVEFDIRYTSEKYFSVFARYNELHKPKKLKRRSIGSRLDHSWIPNSVTRILRYSSSQFK